VEEKATAAAECTVRRAQLDLSGRSALEKIAFALSTCQRIYLVYRLILHNAINRLSAAVYKSIVFN